MTNKTKHLYLTLLNQGPGFQFTHDDVPALSGASRGTVKTLIANLVANGVIERVSIEPGAIKRERTKNGGATGPKVAFRLTGEPYAPPSVRGENVHDNAFDPRPTIRPQALPRWRSIGAWLMGDPPIGRSAASNFHRMSDVDRHLESVGRPFAWTA